MALRPSPKPVRKCHACLLNLGDHCWLFPSPRAQWRHHRVCPGFENEVQYAAYRRAQKAPKVKSLKEIRQEAFRATPRKTMRRTPRV